MEWISLSGTLLNGLQILQNQLHRLTDKSQEQARRALEQLRTAVENTHVYLGERSAGGRRSRRTEARLSTLWHNVADSLRELDHELSMRCRLKGGYWEDPSKWTKAEIGDARIGLNLVKRQTERMLLSKLPLKDPS